jgi:GTP-binding protein Era|tara:strand:- start:3446 stop:4348 length:903 start_codon:yes stop_codon:yes gene_type:complete
MTPNSPDKCGYVAIVGRPNVGKSSLLNRILGQKLSITSRKPQTTRHQLLGIKTSGHVQTLYVDTPGLHKDDGKAINRYMNRTASSVITDVDVVVMVVDRLNWRDDDDVVLKCVRDSHVPTFLTINKVDLLHDKSRLLPHLEFAKAKMSFEEMIPISASTGHNVGKLEQLLTGYLPAGQHFFPGDQLTDRNERFIAAEIIREKITRQLGDELPYEIAVQVDRFAEEKGAIQIDATILVEREGQKGIVIGKQGARLKKIGSQARRDIESFVSNKVTLKLWVRVRSGWSDSDRALVSLGYESP